MNRAQVPQFVRRSWKPLYPLAPLAPGKDTSILASASDSFCARICCSALVDRYGHGVANFVEQFADDRAFLFGERFHSLAPIGDAPAFPRYFTRAASSDFSSGAQLRSHAVLRRAVFRAGA